MVAGIVAVATWLLQNTRARLLLNAVLPRGPTADDPMRKAVLEVNRQLPSHVTRLAGQFGPARVQLVDCGGMLLESDGTISPDIMPDLLHPSAEGHRRLLGCLIREHQLC